MKKVYVGLSGGVDSAVSAALLVERGYDVVGAFIKIWQPEFTECSWREDRLDAMRVAAALGIPFREIDLSDEYKSEVVTGMIADYERGITPNPDVLCNRSIKFGHFASWARGEGADGIATGHYARIIRNGETELHRGLDTSKDQSYFLHTIKEADLASALFPVGEHTKKYVRKLASTFGLPVAAKKDSQGLCFVGDVSIPEFLSRYIELKSGLVVDTAGKKRGRHDGAALYTIGQRHGFVTDSPSPMYVSRIDIASNTLVVSDRRDDAGVRHVHIPLMHWINTPATKSFDAFVQTRYRETPVPARLEPEGQSMRVSLSVPHVCAPGQSLVVYEGDRCLGGGVIA